MLKSDARRLADALEALLRDHVRAELGGWSLATRDRLLRRLTRHLPLDGAEKASEFAPPMWTLNVARKVGLSRERAVALAVVGTVYFSTADLADDIADGDLADDPDDIGIHVTDVCRLTFLYQQAIARVPELDAAGRDAIAETLARLGLDMADGQELDLRSTNAIEGADPVTISRHKSGAEFAALGEMIAIAGGFDRDAWRDFGSAFGTGAQITSDYFDLFLDPESDDWAAAKPTVPIRRALADPRHHAAVRGLLAGRRTRAERKAAGLWHLVQAGAADGLRAAQAAVLARLEAAVQRTGQARRLRKFIEPVADIGQAIAEALDEYRGDPRPPVGDIEDEHRLALQRAERFLESAPRPDARGPDGLWLPLMLLDADAAAGAAGAAMTGAIIEPLLAAVDADTGGARRHPQRGELPPDADATGRLIRLAAAAGLGDHPAVRRAADTLLSASRRDGLVETWLGDRRRFPDAGELPGQVCPVTVAVALRGLLAVDEAAHHGQAVKGALLLARLLERGPPQCRSAFYGQGLVESEVSRFLLAMRALLRDRDREAVDRALAASAARSLARLRLDGRMGDVVETAARAHALFELHRAGLLDTANRDTANLDAIARALIDAQAGDGGYPPDACFRAPGGGVEYDALGDRRLSTALVRCTLARFDARRGD